MRLITTVVGLHNFNFVAIVEPHDTIATLLDQLVQRFVELDEPHEFIAYSASQDGEWRLHGHSDDLEALLNRDPAVMARYLTPTARLDPAKTVVDFFGHDVTTNRVHILLEWSPASWRDHEIRTAAKQAVFEAKQRGMIPNQHTWTRTPIIFKGLRLITTVVGLHNFNFVAIVEPHDTIATLLDQLVQRFVELDEPHEFIAYSASQDGEWRLHGHSDDLEGLLSRDPAVMARYLTPIARLDPAKTVVDYFGHDVTTNRVHILLEWSPASWRDHEIRAAAKQAVFEAKQRELMKKMMAPRPKPVPADALPTYTGIRLRAMRPGQPPVAFSLVVEPQDSMATLLDLVTRQLEWYSEPPSVAACAAASDNQWVFQLQPTPDSGVVEKSDGTLAELCVSPAARVDPTKTVADYFGNGLGASWRRGGLTKQTTRAHDVESDFVSPWHWMASRLWSWIERKQWLGVTSHST